MATLTIGRSGEKSAVTYRVLLSRQARRYYGMTEADTARRLNDVFEILESNPRPDHSKPLKGDLRGHWRIRVGSLRIIYLINEDSKELRIIKIAPRGDVY